MQPSEFTPISIRLQSVKDTFAELFMLMDSSVRENPLTENVGGLDKLIEPLMRNAEQLMLDFRREVAEARQHGSISPATEAAIGEFEGQLRVVLELMSERVTRRAGELTIQCDDLKDRFQLVRRKQRGAEGYRNKFTGSKLLDSKI